MRQFRFWINAGKADDINLELSHEARLLWVDAASQKAGYPPASGSPENPAQIWSLDGTGTPGQIGGFALRLLDSEGREIASIPVVADRLALAGATLAVGIALAEPPP